MTENHPFNRFEHQGFYATSLYPLKIGYPVARTDHLIEVRNSQNFCLRVLFLDHNSGYFHLILSKHASNR